VINNELYFRFIKCNIAQKKGIKINWEKATASMVREKLGKKKIARWKLAHRYTSTGRNGSGMEGLVFLGDDNVII
jgi:hypothetical protein